MFLSFKLITYIMIFVTDSFDWEVRGPYCVAYSPLSERYPGGCCVRKGFDQKIRCLERGNLDLRKKQMINGGVEMRQAQFVRVPLHPHWTQISLQQGSYLRALSVRRYITWEPCRRTRETRRVYCVVIYTVTSRILQQVQHPKRFHRLVMGKSCSFCELKDRQFVGGLIRSHSLL